MKAFSRFSAGCLVLAAALSGGPARADSPVQRFRAYESNYVIVQGTDGDQGSLEARYSLRYDFRTRDPVQFFFSYTGEFDFYWLEHRESSPVINRLSNPALHLRFWEEERDKALEGEHFEWLDVGFEHMSNGQAADAEAVDPEGRRITELQLEADNREYFDTISRGTNYLSAEGSWAWWVERCRVNLRCQGKLHYWEGSNPVTWGKDIDRTREIWDYDVFVVRTSFNWKFDTTLREMEWGVKYTCGLRGLRTDSLDGYALLSIGSERSRFPLYVRGHIGPYDILADYTKPRKSIGGGILMRL